VSIFSSINAEHHNEIVHETISKMLMVILTRSKWDTSQVVDLLKEVEKECKERIAE